MYVVRKQKIQRMHDDDGKVYYVPADTYTVEECKGVNAFMMEVVNTSQFRVRGWKYRLMEVTENPDTGEIGVRFDWQKSSPTE